MFLLRCGFWLSVVYAAIFMGMPRSGVPTAGPGLAGPIAAATRAGAPFGGHAGEAAARTDGGTWASADRGPPAHALVDAARSFAGGVAAVAGAARTCRDSGTDCTRDAADMTALVRLAIAAAPQYNFGAPAPETTAATQPPDALPSGSVPMPVPDPRRHDAAIRRR